MSIYMKLQNPALKEAMRRSMDPAKFAEMERNATDDMNAFVASNPSPTKRKVIMGIAEPISKIDPSSLLHYYSTSDHIKQTAGQFEQSHDLAKKEFALKDTMVRHDMRTKDSELALRQTYTGAQIQQIDATTQKILADKTIEQSRYLKESSKELMAMANQDYAKKMSIVAHLDEHLKLSSGILHQRSAANIQGRKEIDQRLKDIATTGAMEQTKAARKNKNLKYENWPADLQAIDKEITELTAQSNALRTDAVNFSKEAAANAASNTPEGRDKYLKEMGIDASLSYADSYQTNLAKERAGMLSDKFRGGDQDTIARIATSDPTSVRAMLPGFKVVNGLPNSPLSDKDIREAAKMAQYYYSKGITPPWEAFANIKSQGATYSSMYTSRLRDMYDAMITLKGKM